MGIPVLETKRLLLRQFTPDDFEAVHSYAGCYENIRYMIWGPNAEADTRNFINFAIEEAKELPCRNFQYAATRKEDGRLIGACNIALTIEEEAEVGWVLHRDAWKQGYGPEMGRALLNFGFERLGLRRILAHCAVENYGSYRVMEKIGMRREGCFVQARPANALSGQEWCDEYCYAVLRQEWGEQG